MIKVGLVMGLNFTSTTKVVARIPPLVKTRGFLRDYSVKTGTPASLELSTLTPLSAAVFEAAVPAAFA